MDPIAPGLVGRCRHAATLLGGGADDDRQTAQLGPVPLLDGGEERVELLLVVAGLARAIGRATEAVDDVGRDRARLLVVDGLGRDDAVAVCSLFRERLAGAAHIANMKLLGLWLAGARE